MRLWWLVWSWLVVLMGTTLPARAQVDAGSLDATVDVTATGAALDVDGEGASVQPSIAPLPAPPACNPACRQPFACQDGRCAEVCEPACDAGQICSLRHCVTPPVAYGPGPPIEVRAARRRRHRAAHGGSRDSSLMVDMAGADDQRLSGAGLGDVITPSGSDSGTSDAGAGDDSPSEAHPFVLGLGAGAASFVTDTWHEFDYFTGASRDIGGGAGIDLALELGSQVASIGCHPGLYVGGRLAWLGSGNAQAFDASLRLSVLAQALTLDGIRFLAGPTLAAGPTLLVGERGAFMMNIEVGGEVHAVFLDGMFGVWLRPFSVDLQFAQYFLARWELLVGVEARL